MGEIDAASQGKKRKVEMGMLSRKWSTVERWQFHQDSSSGLITKQRSSDHGFWANEDGSDAACLDTFFAHCEEGPSTSSH